MTHRQLGKILLLLGLALSMAGRRAAALEAPQIRERVRAYRAAHEKEIVGELSDLVALRNVASNRVDVERNADRLIAMLRRRGIEARRLAAGDAPPAVYGELRSPGATRTVVFYAHYDGQPAEPADWSGEDPGNRCCARAPRPRAGRSSTSVPRPRSIPSRGSSGGRRAMTRGRSWRCSPPSTPCMPPA